MYIEPSVIGGIGIVSGLVFMFAGYLYDRNNGPFNGFVVWLLLFVLATMTVESV